MWPLPIIFCLQIVQETPLEVVYFEKTKRGLYTKMDISFEVDSDDILFAMPAPTVTTKGTRTYYVLSLKYIIHVYFLEWYSGDPL